jgi:hypothetical protein
MFHLNKKCQYQIGLQSDTSRKKMFHFVISIFKTSKSEDKVQKVFLLIGVIKNIPDVLSTCLNASTFFGNKKKNKN